MLRPTLALTPTEKCHCFICGKATENIDIHNSIYGTAHNVETLRAKDDPLRLVPALG